MSIMDEHEQRYNVPMNTLDSSTQMTKINKRQILHKEIPEILPKISKPKLVAANEIKKISLEKTDHQSLLKLKKDIIILLSFKVRESH